MKEASQLLLRDVPLNPSGKPGDAPAGVRLGGGLTPALVRRGTFAAYSERFRGCIPPTRVCWGESRAWRTGETGFAGSHTQSTRSGRPARRIKQLCGGLAWQDSQARLISSAPSRAQGCGRVVRTRPRGAGTPRRSWDQSGCLRSAGFPPATPACLAPGCTAACCAWRRRRR